MTEPGHRFIPYDCCRCTNEKCADRETCLRWLNRQSQDPRTPFFYFEPGTEPTERCEHYWKSKP